MADAAHPQPTEPASEQASTEPPDVAAKNPFPTSMTVPDAGGQDLTVDLAVVDGVVYAPELDDLPLEPHVRHYVNQFCAAWSQTVLTGAKLAAAAWPAPPRRAQIVFGEDQIRAMLGLAPDESVVATVVNPLDGVLRFVVESPRLPPKPFWNVEPLQITLPIAAHYEAR